MMSDVFKNISYAYIEYYVGMAKMVAYWHVKALGFELKGYCGPETGNKRIVSYILGKGDVTLVITSAAQPTCFDILSFVDRHGNGVSRVAFAVDDVKEAWKVAMDANAIPIKSPQKLEDEHGYVEQASVKLFDRKEIVFFDNTNYNGVFKPGYEPWSIEGFEPDFENGFEFIDHIAYGLHVNETDFWCNYFQRMFGGDIVQELKPGDVITEYSGLLLRLLASPNRKIYSVFVEPENKSRPSQVQEYLEAYYGSGIQHMAFATSDIFGSVDAMRKGGVDFVQYPPAYYEMLAEESGLSKEMVDKLQRYNVLCDHQGDSFLFQTFTKPFGDRPTFFYEIIQRTNGYQGFALGNITQLFRAVEREQSKRHDADSE